MPGPAFTQEVTKDFSLQEPIQSHVERARTLVEEAWKKPMSDEPLHEARTLLETAIGDDPDDVIVLTCLGAVLCDLRQASDALPYLQHAADLRSGDGNTYFNLFIALLGSGDATKAKDVLAMTAHYPRHPLTWQAYFDPHGM